ncbi:hypothetical protein TRFO_38615 [Tritrichomonas foetus]|uniref:Uncharacterized protein n=1 Tax=Tritrichomonas foetus TaxID=1144522 RepID=A0A1J4JCC3_9EUKA|nr:hypothetical protein TRFO_38615 [Tritrichomonas foetus]|eukprot:OHS95299.1 hypothetical protein TRFO_38615 [Tritrichomonas foetus]
MNESTTDFTYYEQFKFALKKIDSLEWYIEQTTPPSDLDEVKDLLLEEQEFNDFMNQLNDKKIPNNYGDLVLTTKIKD